MKLTDPKHNSFIEVTVDQGFFKMDAQVRLHSLLEMYAISAVLVMLKILLWKRIRAWWLRRKASRIKYK